MVSSIDGCNSAFAKGAYLQTLVGCCFLYRIIAHLCISVAAWSLNNDVLVLVEPLINVGL